MAASLAAASVMAASAGAEPQSYQLADAVALQRSAAQVNRTLTWQCQKRLGLPRTETRYMEKQTRSLRAIRWVERLWGKRLAACERMEARRTLPAPNDWVTAVKIAQRPYPGTERWLLSCSGAEGGHGRWVWYGGREWNGYHIGNDYLGADTVGGWMQYRYSTFAPYWRGAVKDLRRRGFLIPDLGDGYGPWLEPLGQALTGGYMRYYGKTGSHWAASWGRGC